MTEDTPKYQVGRIEQVTETPRTDAFAQELYADDECAVTEPAVDMALTHARALEQENAKLRGQRDALVKLAREGNYGVRGWRSDNCETSNQYVERRIAEILGEGDGRV